MSTFTSNPTRQQVEIGRIFLDSMQKLLITVLAEWSDAELESIAIAINLNPGNIRDRLDPKRAQSIIGVALATERQRRMEAVFDANEKRAAEQTAAQKSATAAPTAAAGKPSAAGPFTAGVDVTKRGFFGVVIDDPARPQPTAEAKPAADEAKPAAASPATQKQECHCFACTVLRAIETKRPAVFNKP